MFQRRLKEWVVENILSTVNINEIKFEFYLSRDTTDAIFIHRKLPEKFLAKHKKLCMAFAD